MTIVMTDITQPRDNETYEEPEDEVQEVKCMLGLIWTILLTVSGNQINVLSYIILTIYGWNFPIVHKKIIKMVMT